MLLHSETDFPNNAVRELPARNNGGPYFELLENEEVITACDVSSSVVPSPKPLYIPCHTKCVSIAKRAMAAQQAALHGSVDESMRHLWRVLKSRFEKASEDKFGPICNIYRAQPYGEIWRFQDLVWQPGENDPELRFESMVNISLRLFDIDGTDFSQHFEADPEEVPDTTKSILSHLQTLSAAQHQASSSDRSQLPLYRELSLECTFQSPPSAWREALAHGYLPWLWDLEPDAIAHKEACKSPGKEWNWELFVRQLAQVNLHEPRAVLEDLPMGLRNRRRIWRLVEDILSQEVIDVEVPK